MKISVSDLCFAGFKYQAMTNLNKKYGIEFFYEFGKNSYWDAVLPQMQKGRTLAPSVHGPCIAVNLADPTDNHYLSVWRKTLSYAHHIKAEFVVVHTNEAWTGQKHKVQSIVMKRLKELMLIAAQEKVLLAVENVGLAPKKTLLFGQEEYLQLLEKLGAKALIDIGHAHINGWDIPQLITELGSNLLAIHAHDNDGEADLHNIIGDGNVDWAPIFAALKVHAPEARIVLEYANADLNQIESSIKSIKNI